ncbi:MAG: S-methyl-5'-thioadenosine phosphorylase [Asgard group archaeon]|nr:S-methyl-5'-thioadenosine phosphorylase [Asgard group archaeon]
MILLRKNNIICNITEIVQTMVKKIEKIGIIGGSGFYSLVDTSTSVEIKTPFGDVKLEKSEVKGKEVFFLPRHGSLHSIPPHMINYRANIYALFSVGVTHIISTSAVGSLYTYIDIDSLVIPDQFIDFTIKRPKTFFDGNFSVEMPSGEIKKGVVHTDFTYPYCPELRKIILKEVKRMKKEIHERIVYACMEGPRFETPAEIEALRRLGVDVVGMTSASECILANELDLCYATIGLVTNFAAGMQKKVSADEVFKVFQDNIDQLKQLVLKIID